MIKAGFEIKDWGFTKECTCMCLYNYDGTNVVGYVGLVSKPDIRDTNEYVVAVFTLKQLK